MTTQEPQAARERRYALEEVLDGELSPPQIERMLEHFSRCPECADEVERLRALKDLLRRSCTGDQAPARLRERISVECRDVSVTTTTANGTTRITRSTTRIRRD